MALISIKSFFSFCAVTQKCFIVFGPLLVLSALVCLVCSSTVVRKLW